MNEFLSPGSAARLAGTFDQPEGLLTAAVRRQPFAVVLLDEIEKANPEVFDLLLQVLGEGRLTDALGRTVDFSNILIVLTSNLGVREAQQALGFRGEGHNAGAYVQAAQKFFRPEFFNRLVRPGSFSFGSAWGVRRWDDQDRPASHPRGARSARGWCGGSACYGWRSRRWSGSSTRASTR